MRNVGGANDVIPGLEVERSATARGRRLEWELIFATDDVAFGDAAKYVEKTYIAAAAVAPDGTPLNDLTIQTQKACEAEQVTTALARAFPQRDTIFTDFKPAALAYRRGTLCQAALSNLTCAQINVDEHIHWFPGHEGLNVQPGVRNGNELAHHLARDLTRGAGTRAG
ncbi:hypothetical protein HPB52_018848 [Rhipicephalus sanguineus]|uniref:Tick transposon n=1 Tax=Rhipicephalus sanguineus TaxID=34632 RepID=A0A9D4PE56_RHISA|nr:hypothetical protein HPB52_018848 [Rhipicephalus sanguineus]